MPLYLLDTNILIDLAGPKSSRSFFDALLEEPDTRLGTSILCLVEFMAGADAREEKFMTAWISSEELDLIYLDMVDDAIRAGALRKKHSLALPDALILVAAARLRAHLLTHDDAFLKKAKRIVRASDPIGL